MGRFRIYAQNEIPDGILENIKSDNFITSTGVTLSESRHIFWEVMFGRFITTLLYKNKTAEPVCLDRVLIVTFEEAIKCLETFKNLKINPFIQPFISKKDFEYLVERFITHVRNRLNRNYLIYNITEVLNSYNVASTENELIKAIGFSKEFYNKILIERSFIYQEALYGLSGTPFKINLQKFGQIECKIEKPSLEEYYLLLAGVEDM